MKVGHKIGHIGKRSNSSRRAGPCYPHFAARFVMAILSVSARFDFVTTISNLRNAITGRATDPFSRRSPKMLAVGPGNR